MSDPTRKKSLFERLKIKAEKKFGKAPYGKSWTKDNDWYNELYNSNPLLHKDFVRYLNEKSDVKTVLEIGCGTGIYPIQKKELFSNMKYTGIDFSEVAVEFCRNNSQFEFICGDFIKMELPQKYDLVFSHAVVDHVYDIDTFITKIVKACGKYAYISSYRGFFPNLDKHKMTWDGHIGSYFNDLSVKQIKEILRNAGLTEDEFKIRAQESGQAGKNVDMHTVIEINKKLR